MRLNDKVAIITGGASGIGEAAAMLFAKEGAKVVIVDVNEAEARRVAGNIAAGIGSAIVIKTDVSKEADVQALVVEVIQQFGKIDILFNNAATINPKLLEQFAEDEINRLIDINLKGVLFLIKHAIPYLQKVRGSIVNMASLNGLVGQKQNPIYAATKGGIVALTKSLALDYAIDGVRVNCICPAGVKTPLLDKWIEQQDDPANMIQVLNDMHALGRPAEVEEIAKAALFLVSEDSSFITGVALPVDGGASLGY